MPISPLFSKLLADLKIGSARKNKGAAGTGSQITSHTSPLEHPRAASPAPPSVLARGTRIIDSEQKTLGSATVPGRMYVLSGEIINLELAMSFSATTGPTAATDFAKLIDHIQIADGAGDIVCNIPGGTALYDNYVRFTVPKPIATPANSIAAAATSGSAVLQLPGLRLAAARGPHQITFYYSAAPAGSAGFALTNTFRVFYGDAAGYESRISYQAFSLATGDNHLENLGVPQGRAIGELFMENWTSVTNLSRIAIFTGSVVVEENLTEASIAQRDLLYDYGKYETTTLVLREPATFILGPTSQFIVSLAAADTPTFVWYTLEKV
jgi:hypothetical protein